MRPSAAAALSLLAFACGSPTSPPEVQPDGGASPGPNDGGGSAVHVKEGATNEALSPGLALPDASTEDVARPDPCPKLPIPSSLFGRSVVYREWGPDATGDGSYFTSPAPARLGFSRAHGVRYIVKSQVESDTYLGRVSAYGDSVGGAAWISDSPSNPAFAVANALVAYGVHGGGSLD